MRMLAALIAVALTSGCAAPSADIPAASPTPPFSATPSAPVTEPSPSPPPLGTETPAPARTPAPAAPACPEATRRLGEIALAALCPDGVELRIADTLGERDRADIVAQVADDLLAVQQEFAWTLRTRALVYVLADRDGYVAALERVFGYGAATAEYVADNSVAFFEPSLRTIAVQWDAVRDRRPIAALRHELTHVVTLEACQPRCDLVPAWLNEGQARLAEALIPGSDWRLMRVRYEAASMIATDTFLPLTALWTQAQWNALADWIGYYKYQEAARATELLRTDIGADAIARLYARIRAGQDITTAYAALAGRPFASFTASLQTRIREGADAARGIATIAPGADGGVSFLLYGFPAEAKVRVRVHSHAVDESQEISVSPQGAWFGGIDASYPQGVYTITAASGSTAAAVTVVKRGGRAVRAAPLD